MSANHVFGKKSFRVITIRKKKKSNFNKRKLENTYNQTYAVRDKRLKQLKIPEYRDYLLTDHWIELSKEIRQRDKICRVCSRKAKLEVHHLTYRNMMRSSERNDLISVCETCHKSIHNYAKVLNKSVYIATKMKLNKSIKIIEKSINIPYSQKMINE